MLVLFIIYMPKGILGAALEGLRKRKGKPKATVALQFRARSSAHSIREEQWIERDNLRDVGYRIFGQSRLAHAEGRVAAHIPPRSALASRGIKTCPRLT